MLKLGKDLQLQFTWLGLLCTTFLIFCNGVRSFTTLFGEGRYWILFFSRQRGLVCTWWKWRNCLKSATHALQPRFLAVKIESPRFLFWVVWVVKTWYILICLFQDGKKYYKIQWEETWAREEDLENCTDLLESFNRNGKPQVWKNHCSCFEFTWVHSYVCTWNSYYTFIILNWVRNMTE